MSQTSHRVPIDVARMVPTNQTSRMAQSLEIRQMRIFLSMPYVAVLEWPI